MTIQIETVMLTDGSNAAVIFDVEAVKACVAENAKLRSERLHDAHLLGEQSGEIAKLRSLLQQMLDVAEHADETGYVTDVGFVDVEKLHAQVRAELA